MTLFWLSLALSLAFVLTSAVYATLQGLESFRAFRLLGHRAGRELSRIEATTGEIERRLSLAAEREARLDGSIARLRRSRAQLNVLTTALDDAFGPARRARATIRK